MKRANGLTREFWHLSAMWLHRKVLQLIQFWSVISTRASSLELSQPGESSLPKNTAVLGRELIRVDVEHWYWLCGKAFVCETDGDEEGICPQSFALAGRTKNYITPAGHKRQKMSSKSWSNVSGLVS